MYVAIVIGLIWIGLNAALLAGWILIVNRRETKMPKRAMTEKSLPPFDLKAAREARGLNQSQVAEILCASQASVARWEADGNVPLIYRKYWDLYWSIQKSAKATKRAKAPNVTATADATHE